MNEVTDQLTGSDSDTAPAAVDEHPGEDAQEPGPELAELAPDIQTPIEIPARDGGDQPETVMLPHPDQPTWRQDYPYQTRMTEKEYQKAKRSLQIELLKMQSWVKATQAKVACLFEGRDAAGKGGTIKRFTENLNPRGARVVALEKPSEREATQWYFQRYISALPSGGEIVLFDRSWYNRAGVERVMGFCSEEEHQLFLRQCPSFERMLIEDGIHLVKYWFSVSDDEQERRFQARLETPLKRWKVSDIDIESRQKWVDYSRAKDEMFAHCDVPDSPWYQVEADDKKKARINCISHFLWIVPYKDRERPKPALRKRRPSAGDYERPPRERSTWVPDHAATLTD